VRTVTEHLRAHALEEVGIVDMNRMPDFDELWECGWLKEFELMQRRRMVLGQLRYGINYCYGKRQYDRVGAIARKIEAYRENGNLELLVDVANLCMLEFGEGNHPNRHFGATDDEDHVAASNPVNAA
jgi:hypothetical protein